MSDDDTTVGILRSRIATFVREREWEPFHNPKDLSSALCIEAAELMELFLWKDVQETAAAAERPGTRRQIKEELADIVILTLSLANRLGIDVAEAVDNKLAINDAKYPANAVRGKAHKYTYYESEP